MNRKTHLLSLVLALAMILQLTACGFVKNAKDTAENIKETVADWYESIDLSAFKAGWDSAVDFVGTTYSSALASDQVSKVGTAINELKETMNSAYGSARGTAQEAGFAAEKWIAGTFNIDAAANGSNHSAEVVNSNELGSADVRTDYGELVSSKFYQNGNESANAQSKTLLKGYYEYKAKSKNPKSLPEYMDSHGYDYQAQGDLLASQYEGQTRIIPSDQLQEAFNYLKGRIKKLSSIEGEASAARQKSYEETLNNLKDRLAAPDGTQSKPVTYEEMQAITELCQNGEFRPEDFGITLSSALSPKYVLKQAIGTGVDVALMKAVFTVGPDVASILYEAVRTGKIDKDALKEVGIDGAIASSEGFVEGSLARIITTLCKTGALGANLKDASPTVIGALVFLVIEAMISGYSLAKDEITSEEYGCLMADKIMITALSLPTAAVMLSVLPHTKLFVMIGCFAGGMIACSGYTMAKEVVMELVDGGGFEAIIPVGIQSTISKLKDAVTDLHLNDKLSNLKQFAVTTATNGYIKVKEVIGS